MTKKELATYTLLGKDGVAKRYPMGKTVVFDTIGRHAGPYINGCNHRGKSVWPMRLTAPEHIHYIRTRTKNHPGPHVAHGGIKLLPGSEEDQFIAIIE